MKSSARAHEVTAILDFNALATNFGAPTESGLTVISITMARSTPSIDFNMLAGNFNQVQPLAGTPLRRRSPPSSQSPRQYCSYA